MQTEKERTDHLSCDTCGRRFEPGEVEMTCPDCGPGLGTLTVHYPYEAIARELTRETLASRGEPSHWRYLEILPVSERPGALHPRVGWTPLYELPALARSVGCARLFVKDDGLNPSASFKDRASSVGVARALQAGQAVISAASTGNAASSVSLFAACAGLRCVIFVPQGAPEAKLAQLLMFGAEVLAVRGSYDQAFDLCLEACGRQGWYCRNTAVNPYLGEGKKTAALEICEQLDFDPPDAVVVSVGDGCIIGGLWKGFCDFQRLGLIERLPRVYGVQAAGAAPLVAAFERGARAVEQTVEARTLADSICVGRPRDHIKALRAVRESGGAMLAVEDEEILEAMRRLAREAGVFAEPAGATGFAGLCRMSREGLVGRDERAVVLVTGNGLKDVQTAIRAVERKPQAIDADLPALERYLAGLVPGG
ncbi:MAG: threonine synthase [Deltaproteobacteria bacterium]|nr:threonine synthase [Deltaproteobacteria bacterium]